MSTLLDFKNELIKAGKILADYKMSIGAAGNLSIRVSDDQYICSPTGSNLGNLQLNTISVTNSKAELLEGNKPTKEIPFHISLYKVNKSINAIVHLHSSYATAYSCLQNLDVNDAIKPITPYCVIRLGKVKVIPYFKPGSIKIAQSLEAVGAESVAFLLANHGMVVGGKTMDEAINNACELEESCKLYFLTKNYSVNYLTKENIDELL